MSEEDQKKLFIELYMTFLGFKESDEKDKIPVSNSELRSNLKKTYESLMGNKPSPYSISAILLLVRTDPAIWDDGLYSQYQTFLNQYKKTMKACLLSILWLLSLLSIISTIYVKNLQKYFSEQVYSIYLS